MKKLIPFAAFVCVLAWSHAADAKPKIAILGLQPIDDTGGADDQLSNAAKLMTSQLRQVAQRNKPLKYDVPSSAFEEFLAVKILYDCADESPECLKNIGKELKVDVLLYGKIERIPGKGYEVRIEILDVDRGQPDGRAGEVVPGRAIGDPSEALKWATALWEEALGRSQTGKLLVTSNVLEGRIYIDNKRVGRIVEGEGRVPLVKAGTRSVRIESAKGNAEKSVKVSKGDETEVEINIGKVAVVKDPDDPEKKPGDGRGGWRVAFYAGLAGAIGLGGYTAWEANRLGFFGGDGHYKTATKNADLEGLDSATLAMLGNDVDPCTVEAARNMSSDLDGKCNDGESAVLRSGVTLGLSIGLGLASGYFFYKGFLQGDSGQERQTGAVSNKKRKDPTVRVLPVGPGEIGASLEVTF